MIKSLPISSAFSAALSAPAVSKLLTRSGSDSSFHGEGYRKIWARLRFASVRASPRRVRRVMGDTGIDTLTNKWASVCDNSSGHEAHFLYPPPISARCHPTRCLALPPVHLELLGCRGSPGSARTEVKFQQRYVKSHRNGFRSWCRLHPYRARVSRIKPQSFCRSRALGSAMAQMAGGPAGRLPHDHSNMSFRHAGEIRKSANPGAPGDATLFIRMSST